MSPLTQRLTYSLALAAVLTPLWLAQPALAEPSEQPATQASVESTATAEVIPAAPASAALNNALPTSAAQTAESEAEEQPSHDLSPWGMYQNADRIVKGVMIGLALASVITWTIALAKGLSLLLARRRLHSELSRLKTARCLKQAIEQQHNPSSGTHLLIEEAREELQLSATGCGEGIKERVSFRLGRQVAVLGRQMNQGTGVLATIGSTAPFVGLFGTVWGIMNSFIGIAKSQTTNLAVVAPGIAEALLATALGLVAAIPAVVIYNLFARGITGYKAQLADASAQVLLLVSRDLEQLAGAERPANAPAAVIKAV